MRDWIGVVFVVIALLGALLLVGAHLDANEQKVDNQIDECVRQGGTPIVVGHAYTSEFKGCTLP